ncbi:hypothetical protein DPMN_062101 [Dreissena polymorpha]|uniref:Uncharacterized protein n=1 Tax=Dreissena polymorpha TaxID=45954 RepID=A0A9D4HJ03_DREPO|nr:hypothetical protein DPMN_062101 [Dreissena polymorpha]
MGKTASPHRDCTQNVTSNVLKRFLRPLLTRYFYSHTGKNAPPLAVMHNEEWTITCDFKSVKKHVFHQIGTIVKNVLTNFHEYSTNNITSKVFTKTGGLTRKTITLPGNEVFQPTATIFELVHDIIMTLVPSMLH